MARRSVRLMSVLIVVLAACSRTGAQTLTYLQYVRFDTPKGTVTLDVSVARTDEEKRRGLMGVRSLPTDAGMAFVWDSPTTDAFWMKGTLIPLSIAFVVNGRVVAIREMVPCRADPCPKYRSGAPYAMAIEANARWFESHGVGVGTGVVLEVGG